MGRRAGATANSWRQRRLLLAGDAEGISTEGDAGVLARVVALTELPDPEVQVVPL